MSENFVETTSCRFCKTVLKHTFLDLGVSPLSNTYLTSEQVRRMEPFYPLHAFVCENCFLVQLEEFEAPSSIFTDYAYFSSYSDTWLAHSRSYVDSITRRLGLSSDSNVVEIASNDGYLLQYFSNRNIPVLGIEPAANVAEVAIGKGIPTLVEFFTEKLAHKLSADGIGADLLIGNNVLAHVPKLNDFVRGMRALLRPQGVITMEFPHLLRLVEQNQFDTIYHEHFSYFSFSTVRNIFAAHGLFIFDVEEIPTHGGSLRIYACRDDNPSMEIGPKVEELLEEEKKAGFLTLEGYLSFSQRVAETKRQLLKFLIETKEAGKSIAGYGAPAKGNTLLNYCGIRTDFMDYTVDRSPHKQGLFLPGTHIPIFHPDVVKENRPDYLVILPWNLKDEIVEQMSYIREWGAKFVTLIPDVKIVE